MEYVYNPRFSDYGESHMRLIENTDKAGLRFVGFADELTDLRHTGWFTDNWQDETVRGTVYQLPAHKGACRYVAGYNDPCNENAACLSFDITDCKTTAANWADHIAERMAEESREADAKFSAENRIDDIAEEITTWRRETLALIKETKQSYDALDGKTAIQNTIRAAVMRAKNHIATLRKERKTLQDNFWSITE